MNLSSLLTTGEPNTALIYGLMGIAIVELVLKGFALWRSARLKQVYWFVAILIINSAGILPIIYLLICRKKYVALQTPKSPPPPTE